MTENEAKFLEKLDELANDTEVDMYSVANLNFFFEESANTIRKLIEEIQQYRAIGTVEDLKTMKENGAFSGVELAQIVCMQMKLKEYQAIGTIEEFKALKEKNEPKEPDYEGDGCWDGHVVIDTWICPNCGKSYEVDYDDYDYCPNCGQHIDHSGLTEDD